MARRAPASAARQINPAIIVVPLVALAVWFLGSRIAGRLKGDPPESIIQKFILLSRDKKTEIEANQYVYQGSGAQPTPTGPGRSRDSFVPHMELGNLTPQDLPGSTITYQPAQINGKEATVPMNVRVSTYYGCTIPAYLIDEDGWKIDLTRTNAEIMKYENPLNAASARATTSGQGGISDSRKPAVPRQ